MGDKSPRQHMAKKPGKTLKEQRAAKHAKVEARNQVQATLPDRKR